MNYSGNRTIHLNFMTETGLIKVDESKKGDLLTLDDIVENPYNFEFVEMETPAIVNSLDDVDLGLASQSSIVNRGIDPNTALETYYAPEEGIVLVTTEENKDNPLNDVVYEVFISENVSQVLKEKYDGIVEPLF